MSCKLIIVISSVTCTQRMWCALFLESHTKKEIHEKLMEDLSNLVSILEPSDVAFGILIYMNNDKHWWETYRKRE